VKTPAKRSYTSLRLVLGDQLNLQHSWYGTVDEKVLYVIAELRQETGYVKHHTQKLCAFFAAMKEFANALSVRGHEVLHLDLDDTATFDSLDDLIKNLCQRFDVTEFSYQQPDEYRLSEQLRQLQLPAMTAKCCVDTEHFLLPFDEIAEHFKPGKATRMEAFYRNMRRRLQILMDGNEPAGGRWNFDSENRNKLSKAAISELPAPLLFCNDVTEILNRLDRHKVERIGATRSSLPWPINRIQALELLQFFISHCLPNFGTYQDAMTAESPSDWSLYHSRLSFALNAKILHPREVVDHCVDVFEKSEAINLAQIEGFVRQIIGWREFIRGIYWRNMPDYQALNSLEAENALPDYFWTGNTNMRCMEKSIKNSLDYSYAHHIQRLMITGNFCLLTGIAPDEVDAWYLGIYIDALQWVELPNTRGMALHADGGIVGSKPYAAGGNYIKKMSDYCSSCHYDVKRKSGDGACPFNSLYWHFMARHQDRFRGNHRMRMLYGSWARMGEESQHAIIEQAEGYLKDLNSL